MGMDKPLWHQMEYEVDSNGKPTPLAKALLTIIDHGCQCEDEEGNGVDECTRECWPGVMEAALKDLWDKLQAEHAHIAIGKEAMETLLAGLESKHANLKPRLTNYSTTGYKDHTNKWLKRVSRARRWLAQCPTATDKAVCPECPHCGCEELYGCEVSSGVLLGDCNACGGRVRIESVSVISPPREPKVEP